MPCVLAAPKLRGGEKSLRFIVAGILLFPLCFLCLYLFCQGQKQCSFFLQLSFLLIFVVFVCPFCSCLCINNAAAFRLPTSENNFLVFVSPPRVFLVILYFFETFNLFVVFAVFLLCSLPCCFGCVTGVFSCLVRFFRRPNLTNVLLC